LETWQRSQFGAFLTANPGFFQCSENSDAIAEYLNRNCPGLRLISAKQLTDAFKRLNAYGLLKSRPTVAPKAAPVARRTTEESAPAEPSEEFMIGRDLQNGGTKLYPMWEVNRMSSETMRRIFPSSLARPNGIDWVSR
jgi:hypothetical protein